MSNPVEMKTFRDNSGVEMIGERTNPFSEKGVENSVPADEELVPQAQAGDRSEERRVGKEC